MKCSMSYQLSALNSPPIPVQKGFDRLGSPPNAEASSSPALAWHQRWSGSMPSLSNAVSYLQTTFSIMQKTDVKATRGGGSPRESKSDGDTSSSVALGSLGIQSNCEQRERRNVRLSPQPGKHFNIKCTERGFEEVNVYRGAAQCCFHRAPSQCHLQQRRPSTADGEEGCRRCGCNQREAVDVKHLERMMTDDGSGSLPGVRVRLVRVFNEWLVKSQYLKCQRVGGGIVFAGTRTPLGADSRTLHAVTKKANRNASANNTINDCAFQLN